MVHANPSGGGIYHVVHPNPSGGGIYHVVHPNPSGGEGYTMWCTLTPVVERDIPRGAR